MREPPAGAAAARRSSPACAPEGAPFSRAEWADLVERLRQIARAASPETVVLLDYPLRPRRRWDEQHPHPQLYTLIESRRAAYEERLRSFLRFRDWLLRIPALAEERSDDHEPCWVNGWLAALDGIALYGILASERPALYLEVGSGHSTRFARRAVEDHGLATRIVSIDPAPRAEIDALCDETIRAPVEEVDLAVFDRLQPGDVLFVDDSHRTFMNSDATTIFLDVLPRLRPGVWVQIHDVMLPFDYPEEWIERYYSEQYLLAAYLLARGERMEIALPNTFVSVDPRLHSILDPLWNSEPLRRAEQHGCSFWLRLR